MKQWGKQRVAVWVGVACALSASAAFAKAYPERPVRIVIPFATGGSNDFVGRLIGEELSKELKQPFIIDNRGGAGGTIGTDLVAKSQADGYTLLLISTPHTANSTLYSRLPYDPIKDFDPIAKLGTGAVVLSVNPAVPAETLGAFLDYAKKNPGKLNYVSSGVGSFQHLSTELFQSQTGVSMLHIPYKGAGAALADVAAGHAQVSIGSILQSSPHIRSGRFRPLAVSGEQSEPTLPDVPTFSEAGLSGYDADNWWGLLAPAGTPPAILETLSTAVQRILSRPDVQKRLEAESATPGYQAPAGFGQFLVAETEKWSALIKKLGVQAD